MPQQLGQNKFTENALKYGFSLWGLPKTGQTTQRRAGDDGDLEKGYPKSGTRFVDNGDGTITDNATGLMWVKEPGAIGGNFGSAGSPSAMNWNNAIDECLALTYAGHNDWRLPNANELACLQDYESGAPIIDPIFANTKQNYYWTSTTVVWNTGRAWQIYFFSGGVTAADKALSRYPRPVRLNV